MFSVSRCPSSPASSSTSASSSCSMLTKSMLTKSHFARKVGREWAWFQKLFVQLCDWSKNRCEASSSSQKLVSAMIGTKSSNVTESIFVEFWFSRVNFLHCPAETRLDCNTNLKMHFSECLTEKMRMGKGGRECLYRCLPSTDICPVQMFADICPVNMFSPVQVFVQ